MSNLPENRGNLPDSVLSDLPGQPKKLPKLREMVAPAAKSIPELLEESVARQEPFRASVEKGGLEMQISYLPPKADKKQELNFKFRS